MRRAATQPAFLHELHGRGSAFQQRIAANAAGLIKKGIKLFAVSTSSLAVGCG